MTLRTTTAPTLESLFRDALPGDPDGPPTTPRQVYGAHWSRATPTPVSAPRLAVWVPEVAAELGLPGQLEDASERERWAGFLSGNALLTGSRPYAMAYGGHQFGHWAGQLGDGRAIVLGDIVHEGRRHELQLKGA
ncbi:MAG TPA: protein adenylyltransferase SelO family protein, partial [Myxococcota bacterium]|nr:protein adenylyltransferase SelO family protein [Myxococcota bacterium]